MRNWRILLGIGWSKHCIVFDFSIKTLTLSLKERQREMSILQFLLYPIQ